VPGTNAGAGALEPSAARIASRSVAICSPTRIPCSFAGPHWPRLVPPHARAGRQPLRTRERRHRRSSRWSVTARVQIATCTATATTLLAWAEAADRFAQAVGDELARRLDGEMDSTELFARVATAGGSHLRELAALPRAAANNFDARMRRASIDI
jgi:hypothetical protein